MSRQQYLRDQAERAERLARGVTDALTVERLTSFAADCRRQIDAMNQDHNQGHNEGRAA